MAQPVRYNPPFLLKVGLLVCLIGLGVAHKKGQLARALRPGSWPVTAEAVGPRYPAYNTPAQQTAAPASQDNKATVLAPASAGLWSVSVNN